MFKSLAKQKSSDSSSSSSQQTTAPQQQATVDLSESKGDESAPITSPLRPSLRRVSFPCYALHPRQFPRTPLFSHPSGNMQSGDEKQAPSVSSNGVGQQQQTPPRPGGSLSSMFGYFNRPEYRQQQLRRMSMGGPGRWRSLTVRSPEEREEKVEVPAFEGTREQAVKALYDRYEEGKFCTEANGAYADVWRDERQRDFRDNALTFVHVTLKGYLDKVLDGSGPLSSDEAQRVGRVLAAYQKLVAKLNREQTQYSRDARDAELKSTTTTYVNQLTAAAGSTPPSHAFVIPGALARKVGPLLERYVKAWDAMGTDGLKGMRYEDVQTMEKLREEIARVVLESGDTESIRAFNVQLRALASQSCSSRDVQNLVPWFKSHLE
ncbi:MAG: hypothetical protein QM820_37070 [Minicystis sp.]